MLDDVDALSSINMGEGDTPLIESRFIGPSLGIEHLFFKLESLNPTGSYKDRFASIAVAELISSNSKICLATSSGNTGAALAAYTARAGIDCHIVIVDGTPLGKVKQMLSYGAQLWEVKDFGLADAKTTQVFTDLQKLAERWNSKVQISAFSFSPFGMQGVQTLAFEIAEALPNLQNIFVPAGGGGLLLGIARGFERWAERYTGFNPPKVHCVQPSGNNTISGPLRENKEKANAISVSTTSISGLQVPNIIDGNEALVASRRSGGLGYEVSDQEVYDLQELLARREGIFCEPAAAVSVAGLIRACKRHEIDRKAEVVCLITGHGFKDDRSSQQDKIEDRLKPINSIATLTNFLEKTY